MEKSYWLGPSIIFKSKPSCIGALFFARALVKYRDVAIERKWSWGLGPFRLTSPKEYNGWLYERWGGGSPALPHQVVVIISVRRKGQPAATWSVTTCKPNRAKLDHAACGIGGNASCWALKSLCETFPCTAFEYISSNCESRLYGQTATKVRKPGECGMVYESLDSENG